MTSEHFFSRSLGRAYLRSRPIAFIAVVVPSGPVSSDTSRSRPLSLSAATKCLAGVERARRGHRQAQAQAQTQAQTHACRHGEQHKHTSTPLLHMLPRARAFQTTAQDSITILIPSHPFHFNHLPYPTPILPLSDRPLPHRPSLHTTTPIGRANLASGLGPFANPRIVGPVE
jgi:hypothetical protein